MRKLAGLTKRITAIMLAGMLVTGSVPGNVLAASTDVDPGQTSEIAEEVFTEETLEASADSVETAESGDASEAQVIAGETAEEAFAEEVVEAKYYTVTLDANGGYFENEWDDAIGEIVEQAEVVEKHIPVDGTIVVVPVFTDPDGQSTVFAGWSLERDGELVSQAEEEYAPVDNCVLYAVWKNEDIESEDADFGKTEGQTFADEYTDQTGAAQESEEKSDYLRDNQESSFEDDSTEDESDYVGDNQEGSFEDDSEYENNSNSQEIKPEQDKQEETNQEVERDDSNYIIGTQETEQKREGGVSEAEQSQNTPSNVAESSTLERENDVKDSGHETEVTEKAEEESISTEPMSTSSPVAGSHMWYQYNGNGEIDIRGYSGDSTIQTTYSNGGYSTILEYDGQNEKLKFYPNGNAATHSSGLTVTPNITFTSDGSFAFVEYTVKNTSKAKITYSLGVCADVDIDSDDYASVYRTQNGLRMVDRSTGRTYYLVCKNISGAPSANTLWFGHYKSRFDNVFCDTDEDVLTGVDSGMAFSWKNQTLGIGSTITYVYMVGIGEAGDIDDYNTQDILEKLDYWSFGNYGFNFNNQYYITKEDKSRLYKNISETEVKRIEEDFFHFWKNISPIRNIWDGSCWGMSSWVNLVNSGKLFADDVNIPSASSLSEYKSDKAVQSAINFYHVQQTLDYVVGQKTEFIEKSQSEQLSLLREMFMHTMQSASGNEDPYSEKSIFLPSVPVLISFDHLTKDKKIEGHVISGCSLEKGDFTDHVNQLWENYKYKNPDGFLDPSWTFDECVKVYDSSNPFGGDENNIYIDSDKDIWCIPFYSCISQSNVGHSWQDNACFKLCSDDISVINAVDYTDGHLSYKNSNVNLLISRIDVRGFEYTFVYQDKEGINHEFRLKGTDSNGDALNYWEARSLGIKIMNASDFGTGSNNMTLLFPESDFYNVISEDKPIDCRYGDGHFLTIVQSTNPGDAHFERSGAAVTTSEKSDIRISVTSNDGFTGTSWHTIETVSNSANELSLYPSEDGAFIVSGDLQDLTITTIEDNRIDETEEWPISTDYDSILIRQENNDLVPYADKDEDGTYEYPIGFEIASGSCGDNLTWSLDKNGTLTISGTGDMYDYNYHETPWFDYSFKKVIVEYGVTSIGEYAFCGCKSVSKVSLTDSITEIKVRSFEGCNMTSLKIPESVTNIGVGAFNFCKSLENITIPNGVKSIGNYAFFGCACLDNVVVPASVTYLGDSAFVKCEELTNINIIAELEIIYGNTFEHCKKLETLKLPSTVISIQPGAFYGCEKLKYINIPPNLRYIGNTAFGFCKSIKSISIPDTVTWIGKDAFLGCENLHNIVLPSHLKVINYSSADFFYLHLNC